MSDELSFKDKIKTLQFAPSGIRRDRRTVEGKKPTGERVKKTAEGDPNNGHVVHTEHAKGDRVDAMVYPKSINASFHQEG